MTELERIKTMYETFIKKISENENEKLGYNEQKDFDLIEKKLKALEIIKEKRVDLTNLLFIYEHEPQYGLRTYNDFVNIYRGEKELTQEEYDLLKEVLC